MINKILYDKLIQVSKLYDKMEWKRDILNYL